MIKNAITLVPVGGLANRMRAMAAGVRMAAQIGSRLDIIWFQDWGLGCRFADLFEPLRALPSGGRLHEASWADHLLFDRPRPRNLYLPKLAQRLCFDRCLYEEATGQLKLQGFDFAGYCRNQRVWMASFVYFLEADDAKIPVDCFDFLHPIPVLQQRIDQQVQAMGTNLIGVHIRRTDHAMSIRQSPTELFEQRMAAEPADTEFYLATDSEEVKARLRKRFGARCHALERQARRGDLQGMQDGLVEMYLLSRTRRILGSAGSTFSTTAASIGRVPLEILSR